MRSRSIRNPYQHLLAACLLACSLGTGVSGGGNASTGGVAVSAYPSVEETAAAWNHNPGGVLDHTHMQLSHLSCVVAQFLSDLEHL